MFRRRHQSTTTGAIIATSGVLSTNADVGATAAASRTMAARSVSALPSRRLPIQSRAPVFRSAEAAAKSAAIKITALLENPTSADWGERTPAKVTSARPAKKSKSTETCCRHCITPKTAATTASETIPSTES